MIKYYLELSTAFYIIKYVINTKIDSNDIGSFQIEINLSTIDRISTIIIPK